MRVAAMSTVTPVHEEVHEWARQNEKVGHIAQRVRQVLGPQQNEADDQEAGADEKSAGCPEAPFPLRASMVVGMIVSWHVALLFDDQAATEHAHRTCERKFAGLLRQKLDGDGLARGQVGAL